MGMCGPGWAPTDPALRALHSGLSGGTHRRAPLASSQHRIQAAVSRRVQGLWRIIAEMVGAQLSNRRFASKSEIGEAFSKPAVGRMWWGRAVRVMPISARGALTHRPFQHAQASDRMPAINEGSAMSFSGIFAR